MSRVVLVTGAAGFIGSALVRRLLARDPDLRVLSVDRLQGGTGRLANLAGISDPRHRFLRGDVADPRFVADLFAGAATGGDRPDVVVHLAAESHVDRSIAGPEAFVRNNVMGTFALLDAARRAWADADPDAVRFHQVSTDEVFGDRQRDDNVADEHSAFAPRSPYAASKAAADHLLQSYATTYGLPTSLTFACNNLGPRQHPEKLVPFMILRGLSGQTLPLYGDGLQIRRWLHVDDHCDAIVDVLDAPAARGRAYGVGPRAGTTNLDLVTRLCAVLDERDPAGAPRADRIRHVADRPGHDRCYHTASERIRTELSWAPRRDLDTALAETVDWYLAHPDWLAAVTDAPAWRAWIDQWYGPRGG